MSTLRPLPMINATTSDLTIVHDLSVTHGPTRPDELSIVQEITIVAAVPAQPTPASRHVMRLLAERVPLSLLCDLADPSGPESSDIASSEDTRSVLGDLLAFRAASAEGGRSAKARAALRSLRLG